MVRGAALALLAGLLASCSGTGSGSATFGRSFMLGGSGSTTTIYGESSGEGIKAMEVAEAARIVGRLRRLNVSEREIIRRVAEERFNFLVALEREALRTKYEIRKAEVRRGALARVSKVQSGVRQGKMAASVARAEQQKIAREEQQLLGALEVDWMAEAREMAKRRYGSNFGIAVESEADKHVVAMADVYGDTLRVAISLYTVNRPVVVVDKVEKIQHNGRAIAVFSGPPVNLPSTP